MAKIRVKVISNCMEVPYGAIIELDEEDYIKKLCAGMVRPSSEVLPPAKTKKAGTSDGKSVTEKQDKSGT